MSRPEPETSRRQRVMRGVFVALVTIVVPAVYVVVAVHEDKPLSTLDEVAHLDYLDRAGDFSFPRMGDQVSDEITYLARCRNREVRLNLDCDGIAKDGGPPEDADGYSYQAQHPPTYYWISAQLQRVTSLAPADNFITTGRLTGVFWMVGGAVALFVALRRLGLGLSASGAACVLLSVSPGLIQSTAKVTNDATSFIAGAAVLLGYTFVRNNPTWRTASLSAAIAGTVVLLKPVNVVAVAAIAAVALVELVPRLGARRGILHAVAPAVVGVVAVVAWMSVVDLVARTDTDIVMAALLEFKQTSDGPPFGQFFLSGSRLLSAYDSGREVAGLGAISLAIVARFAILGSAVVTGVRGGRSFAALVGASAMAMLVVAGVAFNVQFWLSYDLVGGPAARYGYSLLPLLVIPLAWQSERSTRATVGIWILTVFMAITTASGVILS